MVATNGSEPKAKKVAQKDEPSTRNSLHQALSAPLPQGKGPLQTVVDRLNKVMFFDGWGYSYDILEQRVLKFKGGGRGNDITVKVSLWLGDSEHARTCIGGAFRKQYGAALNSAIAKGFLRAAAMWSVGDELCEEEEASQDWPEEQILEEQPAMVPPQPQPQQVRAHEFPLKPAPQHTIITASQAAEIRKLAPYADSPPDAVEKFIADKPSFRDAQKILEAMREKTKYHPELNSFEEGQ